jgi:hypothetical protein
LDVETVSKEYIQEPCEDRAMEKISRWRSGRPGFKYLLCGIALASLGTPFAVGAGVIMSVVGLAGLPVIESVSD